jgi:hypothetical protein
MSHEPANPAPDGNPALQEEDLVAYLDGELDEGTNRRVEALLSSDPNVRQRLRRLQQSWEALGELESVEVERDFTHSTLDLVALAAEKEAQQEQAAAPRRRLRRRVLAAAGLLVASLAGFAAVAGLRPDPNAQLLRDLPLLEELDQYRQIDNMRGDVEQDVAFLRMLHEQRVFEEDGTDHESD